MSLIRIVFLFLTSGLLLSACGGGGDEADDQGSDKQISTARDTQAGRWDGQGWSGGNFSGLPASTVAQVMSTYDQVPPPRLAVRTGTMDGWGCSHLESDALDDPCDFFAAECPGDFQLSFKSHSVLQSPEAAECRADSGELDGYQRYFNPFYTRPFLQWVHYYNNGKRFGPQLTFTESSYGSSLRTGISERSFINEQREQHGPQVSYWFESRNEDAELVVGIKKLEFFINGKRQGKYQEFWPNGNLRTETSYVDGDCEGAYKAYFPDGQLRLTAQCSNGQIVGNVELYHAVYCNSTPGVGRENWQTMFSDGDYLRTMYGNNSSPRLDCRTLEPINLGNEGSVLVHSKSDLSLAGARMSSQGLDLGLLNGSLRIYAVTSPIDNDPYALENQVLMMETEWDRNVMVGDYRHWRKGMGDTSSKHYLWREGEVLNSEVLALTEFNASGEVVSREAYDLLYLEQLDIGVAEIDYLGALAYSMIEKTNANSGDIRVFDFYFEVTDVGSLSEQVTIEVERTGRLVDKPLFFLGIKEEAVELGSSSIGNVDVNDESGLVLLTDAKDNIIYMGYGASDETRRVNAKSTVRVLLEVFPWVSLIFSEFGYEQLITELSGLRDLVSLLESRVQTDENSWSDPEDVEFLQAIQVALDDIYFYADSHSRDPVSPQANPSRVQASSAEYAVTPNDTAQSGIELSIYNPVLDDTFDLYISNTFKRWAKVYIDDEPLPYLIRPNQTYDAQGLGPFDETKKIEAYGMGKGDFTEHSVERWIEPVVADIGFHYAIPAIGLATGNESCFRAHFAPDGDSGWASYLYTLRSEADFMSKISEEEYLSASIVAMREMVKQLLQDALENSLGCAGNAFAKEAFKRLARYLAPGLGSIDFTFRVGKFLYSSAPAIKAASNSQLYETWDVLNVAMQGTWEAEFTITKDAPDQSCGPLYEAFIPEFSFTYDAFNYYGEFNHEDVGNAWGFATSRDAVLEASYLYGYHDAGRFRMEKWFSGGAVQVVRKVEGSIEESGLLTGTMSVFNGNNYLGKGMWCEANFIAKRISEDPGELPPGTFELEL